MEKEIEKLKKQLEKCEQARDEYLNGWKRSKADFVNYKKEEDANMRSMALFARLELLLKIFPILDNLERAVKQIPEEEKDNQVYKGLLQIAKQWKEFLKTQEIEEVETVGKPFNPEFHEAVGEAKGEERGTIVEEVEKGYMTNNKVLRPAKVKVIK